MKVTRLVITLFLATWIGAACAALPAGTAVSSTSTAASGESGTSTVPPPPVPVVSQEPVNPTAAPTIPAQGNALDQVVKKLAAQLNVDPSTIPPAQKEPVSWPDACLGLARAGEVCAQSLTPGYRYTFHVGSQTYIFRTNLAGDNIRQEPQAQSPTGQAAPGAVQKAIQVLAQQLGISQDQIKLVQAEEVEWPDSCLGVRRPGIMCAQMVTPGYRITLEAGGKTYEYHTDLTGKTAIQAQNLLPASDRPVLNWELQGETCQTAEVTLSGLRYGFCKGELKRTAFVDPKRAPELQMLVQTYQSFTADTKAGKVTFTGRGNQSPTPAEQRSIAEWARLLVFEASGRATGTTDLAISWHREGGIAGFCDDLAVYLTGFTYASSCKGTQTTVLGFKRLDPAQMDQVFAWSDSLKSFQSGQKNPTAAADAMSVDITFTGLGARDAGQQDQQAIQTLAETLYNDLRTQSK